MTKRKGALYKSRDKSPPEHKIRIKISEKNLLLKRILSTEFAIWELLMYLDENPHDKKAFELYIRYQSKIEKLKKEYNSRYKC